jgi:hypothetical protein
MFRMATKMATKRLEFNSKYKGLKFSYFVKNKKAAIDKLLF